MPSFYGVIRLSAWVMMALLFALGAVASNRSPFELSCDSPSSPTRAEPGRQGVKEGGDAVLTAEEAGRRVRSQGEAQPAQARCVCWGETTSTTLSAEQAGGWGLPKPELGRYLSPETLGLMGGMSPYAANDPIHFVDPDGLMVTDVSGPAGDNRSYSSTEVVPGRTGNKRERRAGDRSRDTFHPVIERAMLSEDSSLAAHSPTGCSEPRALSDYLDRVDPNRELDPDNPEHRKRISEALAGVEVDSHKTTQSAGTVKRAPCPNCSQMMANLMASYGEPQPGNITEGYANQQRTGTRSNFSGSERGRWGSYQEALDHFARNNPEG